MTPGKLSDDVITEKLINIEKRIDSIDKKLDSQYITVDSWKIYEIRHEQLQKQVDLLQKIVFGVIGLIAMSVVGAIINLVINK